MKKTVDFEQAVLSCELGADVSLPRRMEILAEGFAHGLSSEEVNARLQAQDCETLYPRSFPEATLQYAYDHGLSVEQWRSLLDRCQVETGGKDPFPGGKITCKQLRAYVEGASEGGLETAYVTRFLAEGIGKTRSMDELAAFLQENNDKFSGVREKARYYFCKYLYLYIQEKCENYYKSCEITRQMQQQYGTALKGEERGSREKFALEELCFLKPLTKLKREAGRLTPSMTPEEKRAYLEEASLTPGGIFDEFNYFYFGYVSAGWMEVLFELYGEFDCWPDHTKMRIARSLGLCGSHPTEGERKKALAALEAMAQKEQTRQEEAEGARDDGEMLKKLYQRGRSGEDFFRDFILGKRDINRSTLLSFLLFVRARVHLGPSEAVTAARLNHILVNCGFSQLRPDKAFDRFCLQFLRTREPMELIEAEVEKQVTQGKDFYLYKVYREAYCHREELMECLGVKVR